MGSEQIASRVYENFTTPSSFDALNTDMVNVKVPAGNFPEGFSDCEAMTVGQISAVVKAIIADKVAQELVSRECCDSLGNGGGVYP